MYKRQIEDYISTTYANKMTADPAANNGMMAAVVGSGPAGLTIAVPVSYTHLDVYKRQLYTAVPPRRAHYTLQTTGMKVS